MQNNSSMVTNVELSGNIQEVDEMTQDRIVYSFRTNGMSVWSPRWDEAEDMSHAEPRPAEDDAYATDVHHTDAWTAYPDY